MNASTFHVSLHGHFCYRFFTQKEVSSFLVYYTGHGNKSGNWVLPNRCSNVVKLRQILNVWSEATIRYSTESDPQRRLLLICDSCYSGRWVKALNRCHQCQQFCEVEMIAACGSDRVTLYSETKGSDFTRAICGKQNDEVYAPTYTRSLPLPLKENWLSRCTVVS